MEVSVPRCFPDLLFWKLAAQETTAAEMSGQIFRNFHPANNYQFKNNNRSTRTMCEIYLRLTTKQPKQRPAFFIVNFEYISILFLVLLFLTLNEQVSVKWVKTNLVRTLNNYFCGYDVLCFSKFDLLNLCIHKQTKSKITSDKYVENVIVSINWAHACATCKQNWLACQIFHTFSYLINL